VALLAVSGAASISAAQCASQWVNANAKLSGSAPIRWLHEMTFDSISGKIILHGGRNSFGDYLDGTHSWDGVAWTGRTNNGSIRREGHCMAFVPSVNLTFLFGGWQDDFGRTSDTWWWDDAASSWSTTSDDGDQPGPRRLAAMAFDPIRNEIILFGGDTGTNSVGFACASLDPTTKKWKILSPATVPPARANHSMVFDASTGRIVMFGGRNGAGVPKSDTWEWDGATRNWTKISDSTPVLGARTGVGMVYDERRQKTVLFGGRNTLGDLADTWEYDGLTKTWTRILESGPPPRANHAMAYDSARGHVVVYAGARETSDSFTYYGDTWILPSRCIADFDCTGFVDTEDYSAFVAAFESGSETADVDGTGFVDTEDFSFFVERFEGGC
jgi:Galactose oxidase, central domain